MHTDFQVSEIRVNEYDCNDNLISNLKTIDNKNIQRKYSFLGTEDLSNVIEDEIDVIAGCEVSYMMKYTCKK